MTELLSALAGVGALALFLDFFLPDAHKRWFSDQTMHLWIWLADLQPRSLLDWLRRHHAVRWLTFIALILTACYAIWIVRNRNNPPPTTIKELLAFLLFLGAGIWCGMKFMYWTLKSRTLFIAALRAVLVFGLLYGVLLGVSAFAYFYKDLLTPQGGVVTLFQMLFVIVFIPTVLFVGLVGLFWIVVTVPLALVCTAMIFLWVSEFVVRRTAEYPSGPLSAVSVLCGVAAALLTLILYAISIAATIGISLHLIGR